MPVGDSPKSPHQSAATPFTVTSGEDTIKSGLPRNHVFASANLRAGGASFGSPSGAPESAHFAIFAMSSSDSEMSSLNFWMPMFFSMNHGGITPRCPYESRSDTRRFISRAYGRAS